MKMEEMMLLSRNQMFSILRIGRILSSSASYRYLMDELIQIVREKDGDKNCMKAIIDKGGGMYCHEPGVEGFKYEAHMRMSEMLKSFNKKYYQTEVLFSFVKMDEAFFIQEFRINRWIRSLKREMEADIEEPMDTLIQLKKVLRIKLLKEKDTSREKSKRNHWYHALYDMVSCICTDEFIVPESGTERRK